MSLWEKIASLPPDRIRYVQTFYIQHCFPIEVRHYLASWIEDQPWADIDENETTHSQYAEQLLGQLLTEMDTKANEMDFLARLKFHEIIKQLSESYSSNPMNLVQVIKNCLSMEKKLIAPSEFVDIPMISSKDTIGREVLEQIDMIKRQTEETEENLKHMQLKQEKFVIDYQNQVKLNSQIALAVQQPLSAARTEMENKLKAQKEEMDRQLLQSAQDILQQRIVLAGKHRTTLLGLESLQKQVVDDELIKWKKQQQLHGNGASFDASMIDTLQRWCESLAELLWRNRQQIIKVDLLRQQLPIEIPQGTEDIQPELNKLVTGLLSSLVTSTFIVEQQPPQVLKKESKFQASVRLLVGGKLNLQMAPPRVKATIISEQQARSLLNSDVEGRRGTLKSGEILNNEGSMDYHQQTGQLSITFRNMQLKNIKRADRKGSETVAEEKFCILFSSDFDVGGNELKFQVWTLSLPVIVTVHTLQECHATATFLWDNQFSETGRIPFQVPDSVSWLELAKMLSTKFKAMTGRGLSESNLSFLAGKLFGNSGTDLDTAMVSWSQFYKDSLPKWNFTFWEWFWQVMKLMKDHLKHPWNDGSIMGFVTKTESQDMLMSKPNGTFLLRFSDSELGGITIAWVADQPDKAERQVWNLAPFTSKDFAIRGLADRVKDLQSLVYLYPDVPKAQAFAKYYSPASDPVPSVTQGGYVKSHLINIIDPQQMPTSAGVMNYDNPQTPQSYPAPTSPASSYTGTTAPMTPKQDTGSTSMDMFTEEDLAQLATDYTQEDLDYNKLNEWLQNQNEKSNMFG